MGRIGIFTVFLALSLSVLAQDDLLSMLDEQAPEQTHLVDATFKGTRLINGHSIETRSQGVMDFIIAHRFGTIDGGAYELFGLDYAQVRIGLEYAVTDRLYVGSGRNSFEKTFDGFAKYRLLRQTKGSSAMPVSVTWFSSMSIKTLKQPELEPEFTDKLAYTHQILIASKVTNSISLQLMPTWVHRNLIGEEDLNNDIFAIGVGGRFKFNQRVALCFEYYKQLQKLNDDGYDAIAIGFDIETGGHVFQLQFTNATSMVPKGYVSETTNDFFDGEIHFGFNISRTFQVK